MAQTCVATSYLEYQTCRLDCFEQVHDYPTVLVILVEFYYYYRLHEGQFCISQVMLEEKTK